jgi:exopolysaccharide biosynthesis polyprenyl glycosylphosphotransferase
VTGRHAHHVRAVLGAGDAVAAIAACGCAYLVRFHLLVGAFPVVGRADVLPMRYATALPVAVLLLLLAVGAAGMYEPRRAVRAPTAADGVRICGFAAAGLATVALLYWREFQYSRATLLLAAALFGPLVLFLRGAILRALRKLADPRSARPALLIGGGAPAAALSRALHAEAWPAVRIEAVVPTGTGAAWPGARILGSLEEAWPEIESGRLREVYLAIPADQAPLVPPLLARLEQVAADVRLVPDLGPAVLLNASAAVVAGVPLVTLRESPSYGWRAAAKRTFDVVVSATLLLALAPLLLALALLVRTSSAGRVLFIQERMGMDGRPFRMLKFRTMRSDAESESGPVFARPGDPRATAVGRVLRRTSLDELPQLWNVLRGEMSLVGPRPERAPFIEEFRRRFPGYMLRHAVKAGMTGWAQVHGLRGGSSLEDRLRYDLEYVDRWSLSLDLEILGRTALQVLVGRNAY